MSAVGLSPQGNFSSLYNVMLNEKDEIVFIMHMVFKYVRKEDIIDLFQQAGVGTYVKQDPDRPLIDFVCRAMRFLNMTGRTKYFLTKLENYCDSKGRKSEYNSDYYVEMMNYEGYGYGC